MKKASASIGDSLKQARDEALRKAAMTREMIVEQAAVARDEAMRKAAMTKEMLAEQAAVARERMEQGWTPPVLDTVVDLIQQDSDFIVEIIEARDVPKIDFVPSDPYVQGYIAVLDDGVYKRVSDFVKTPVKMDNDNPVWHVYANFRCRPPPASFLTLCVYNFDRAQILSAQFVNNSRLLGSVRIPVEQLELDEQPRTFFLEPNKPAGAGPGFAVLVRRAFLRADPPARRVIFLVRHGESQWNRAVASKDVAALMALDHPLSPAGIQQAQALARQWREAREALAAEDAADAADAAERGAAVPGSAPADAGGSVFSERKRRTEYLRSFLAADAVYSSPLTRALQVTRTPASDARSAARCPARPAAAFAAVRRAAQLRRPQCGTGLRRSATPAEARSKAHCLRGGRGGAADGAGGARWPPGPRRLLAARRRRRRGRRG